MTCIAYKDGIVAVDSRMSDGNGGIAFDDCDKSRTQGGVKFFFAGDAADVEEFLEYYTTGQRRDCNPLNLEALIAEDGQVFVAGVNEDGILWRFAVPKGEYTALGHGTPHAITAMDLGCSAKEAVRMAAKRDTTVGGRIRTHKVG